GLGNIAPVTVEVICHSPGSTFWAKAGAVTKSAATTRNVFMSAGSEAATGNVRVRLEAVQGELDIAFQLRGVVAHAALADHRRLGAAGDLEAEHAAGVVAGGEVAASAGRPGEQAARVARVLLGEAARLGVARRLAEALDRRGGGDLTVAGRNVGARRRRGEENDQEEALHR